MQDHHVERPDSMESGTLLYSHVRGTERRPGFLFPNTQFTFSSFLSVQHAHLIDHRIYIVLVDDTPLNLVTRYARPEANPHTLSQDGSNQHIERGLDCAVRHLRRCSPISPPLVDEGRSTERERAISTTIPQPLTWSKRRRIPNPMASSYRHTTRRPSHRHSLPNQPPTANRSSLA